MLNENNVEMSETFHAITLKKRYKNQTSYRVEKDSN